MKYAVMKRQITKQMNGGYHAFTGPSTETSTTTMRQN